MERRSRCKLDELNVQELIPLYAIIFCAKPRHKRITAAIGARAFRLLETIF